jgi:hypothetical protein
VLSSARLARAQAAATSDHDEGVSNATQGNEHFGIVDVDVDVWTDADEWGVSEDNSKMNSLFRSVWLIISCGFKREFFRYGRRLEILSCILK